MDALLHLASIIALTPIIGLSLPALTPFIMAAAGAMGYKVFLDMNDQDTFNEKLRQRIHESNTVVLRLEDLIIETLREDVKRAEHLMMQKGNIVLELIKDERGKLKIQVTGPKSMDEKELEREGRLFAEQVSQQFATNRAVVELDKIGAEIVAEEKNEAEEIVLKVRRWT